MKKLLLVIILFFLGIAQAQLSGTYSIGTNTIGGETGNYPTLTAAVTALNAVGVNGPCTFYFTDNATYTDTAIYLAPASTNSTNTITFKPYTGVTATISLTRTANTGVSGSVDGAWSIGSPTGVNTNLVSTNYVTIDGSNTNGGTTKNLTIQGASHAIQIPLLRVFGNCDNITIKNCVIINNSSSGSATAPIQLTNYNNGTTNFSPDNCTIQNNTLTSTGGNGSAGIHISNSGTPTVGITGLVIRDNIISARVRGIFVSYTNDGNIFGNTFSVVSQAAQAAAGISFQTTLSTAGTFNVYNNKITTLTTLNNSAGTSNGIIGFDIQSTTPKIFNIYNNMISGMGPGAASATAAKIYGIRSNSSATVNIYHNTIYIPEMTDMTTFGTSFITGILYASTSEAGPTAGGTMTVKNNIVVSNETGSTMKVYAIRRAGTTGTFVADYNDYYINASHTNGFVGLFNTTDQQSFANWQSGSSQDANSKNVDVAFNSVNDLHLASGSNGNGNFIGVSGLAIVTTDIDGDSRSGSYPYMGADEGSIALPVELISFSAVAKGKNIELKWNTATEINNHGFEVEKNIAGTWGKIGFVEGHGTTNAPQAYKFVDGSAAGTVQYRLKQIDRNGTFTYSNVIEIAVAAAVNSYELGQNFPNPFNPTTTIRFSVKQLEHASVKVFDITGREIATLFNDVASPGQTYNVQFNAAGLASGMYFYVLQTPNAREVKKMSLLK